MPLTASQLTLSSVITGNQRERSEAKKGEEVDVACSTVQLWILQIQEAGEKKVKILLFNPLTKLRKRRDFSGQWMGRGRKEGK